MIQAIAITALIAPVVGYVALTFTWWALLTLPALVAFAVGLRQAIRENYLPISWFFLPVGLSHLSIPMAFLLGSPPFGWGSLLPVFALHVVALGIFFWLARGMLLAACLVGLFCVAYDVAGTIGYGSITI